MMERFRPARITDANADEILYGGNVFALHPSWRLFRMEEPFKRWSPAEPVLIDDPQLIGFLANNVPVRLHVTADGLFVCYTGATDGNYLSGVEVTRNDLYVLMADVQTKTEQAGSMLGIDWQNDPSLSKVEKQRKAILAVIGLKGFDPIMIPDGEKGTIEAICRNDYPLLFDSESSFSNAWKEGRKLNLFRMANHASFAKRGKG